MGFFKALIVFNMSILLLTGCAFKEVNIGPKIEVSSYKEETIKDFKPESLDFDSEYSNFEVYSWDKNDVKFEITKRLRGIYKKNILENKLNDFVIDINREQGRIAFKSVYKGSIDNPADRSLDLKVFVPKKIHVMGFKLETANIVFLDDVDYDLKFNVNAADITINRFNGKIDLNSKIGNVSIKNGRIRENSNIFEGIGNINIRAEFENEGNYNIETNVGNIDLALPEKSRVNFETMGTLEINELPAYSNNTIIKLRTGMGKIAIKKY